LIEVRLSPSDSTEHVRDVIEHLLTTATPGDSVVNETQPGAASSIHRVVELMWMPTTHDDNYISVSHIHRHLLVIVTC